jgi:hypothetical protein
LKALFYQCRVKKATQRPIFERIGHDVIYLDTFFAYMKKMLVVPEPVGSQPLLVNETPRGIDMGDLGQPTHLQPKQRRDMIVYQHAGSHVGRERSNDF